MIKNLIFQIFVFSTVTLVLLTPVIDQLINQYDVELSKNKIDSSTDDVEIEVEELFCYDTNLTVINPLYIDEEKSNSICYCTVTPKIELEVQIPPPKL